MSRFNKFFLVSAALAVGLFSYAQYQGWNAFQDQVSHRSGSSGGGRIYHK